MIMKCMGKRLITSICIFSLTANLVFGATVQEKKEDQRVDNLLTGVALTDAIYISAPDPADGVATKGAWVGGGAFQFSLQEMGFDNRLVTNAPFSVDISFETIQTLSDGTHITQSFEGRSYRDSQGRTRNERAYTIGTTGEWEPIVSIYDPVGGASYTLYPDARDAHKTIIPIRVPTTTAAETSPAQGKEKAPSDVTIGKTLKRVQPSYPPLAKAARVSGATQVECLIGESGEVLKAVVISGHPLLRDAALHAARQWRFEPTIQSGRPVKIRGVLNFNFALIQGELAPVQATKRVTKPTVDTEQLGKQIIEGVECEGERKVTTLPVGAIGNDRPIQTINETWYSKELRMIILSKRSDPRFGKSTYRVFNITRTEPDAALFQVPSDYTIREIGK